MWVKGRYLIFAINAIQSAGVSKSAELILVGQFVHALLCVIAFSASVIILMITPTVADWIKIKLTRLVNRDSR